MVGRSIDTASPKINTAQYAGIQSFEDALAVVQDVFGGEIVDSADLGDGFALVEDKMTLIKVPFIILAANFSEGDYKREDGTIGTFVSCRIVTEDGRKLVLNDGSTGIHDQIQMLWAMKPETVGKPIVCRNGLRVSEYDHPQHGKSRTFYLDTSGRK
jgi:hypothetical protein